MPSICSAMAEEKAIPSERRTHLINLRNVGTKNLANAFETLRVSRRISGERQTIRFGWISIPSRGTFKAFHVIDARRCKETLIVRFVYAIRIAVTRMHSSAPVSRTFPFPRQRL